MCDRIRYSVVLLLFSPPLSDLHLSKLSLRSFGIGRQKAYDQDLTKHRERQ